MLIAKSRLLIAKTKVHIAKSKYLILNPNCSSLNPTAHTKSRLLIAKSNTHRLFTLRELEPRLALGASFSSSSVIARTYPANITNTTRPTGNLRIPPARCSLCCPHHHTRTRNRTTTTRPPIHPHYPPHPSAPRPRPHLFPSATPMLEPHLPPAPPPASVSRTSRPCRPHPHAHRHGELARVQRDDQLSLIRYCTATRRTGVIRGGSCSSSESRTRRRSGGMVEKTR